MAVLDRSAMEDKIISDALVEDIGLGDITTDSIVLENKISKFNLFINQKAIISGLNVFQRVFQLLDPMISCKPHCENGDELQEKGLVCTLNGNAKNILKGERTGINFLAHLSGVATATRELVKLIDEYNVVLLDTRKTTPGLRIFEKKAICDGGAKPHRFNLNEMILIKDNHKTIAGGIKNAIELVRKDLQAGIRIEVEVENVSELKEAINCNPDIIMFDNWSVDNLKEGVKLVPNHIFTEASGMINKSNIKGYAKTGIKSISTSYMIKERKWVDFSLEAVG